MNQNLLYWLHGLVYTFGRIISTKIKELCNYIKLVPYILTKIYLLIYLYIIHKNCTTKKYIFDNFIDDHALNIISSMSIHKNRPFDCSDNICNLILVCNRIKISIIWLKVLH